MTIYIDLTPQDVPFELLVFWTFDSLGKRVIRPEYKDLLCPGCGKVDVKKALERGVSDDVIFTTTRDLFGSRDCMYLVNVRTRQLLEDITATAIDYYEVPSVPDYFVALPRKLLIPHKGDPNFLIQPECKVCGHLKDARYRFKPMQMNVDVEVGAFALENGLGLMPLWFVSENVVKAVKATKPKLRGFSFGRALNPPECDKSTAEID